MLRERGFSSVNYSLPYCNFLIRLHNFAEKHDNILKCALGLKFIHINFAMLKQVFKNWGGKEKLMLSQACDYCVILSINDFVFVECINKLS